MLWRLVSKWTFMTQGMGSTQRSIYEWTEHKSPLNIETLADKCSDTEEDELELDQSEPCRRNSDQSEKGDNDMVKNWTKDNCGQSEEENEGNVDKDSKIEEESRSHKKKLQEKTAPVPMGDSQELPEIS